MANGLLTDENGFVIKNGGFAVGETLEQEVEKVMQMNVGDDLIDPLLGPNLVRKINSTDLNDIKRSIKLSLQRDGKEVKKIEINGTTIKPYVREL